MGANRRRYRQKTRASLKYPGRTGYEQRRARLAQTLRIQLKVPTSELAKVSGCVSEMSYVDCENTMLSPPLGWAPVFDKLRAPLGEHVVQHGEPPFGVLYREVDWVLNEEYK